MAVEDALGNISRMVYAKDGTVQETHDPLGVVTAFRYDQARRRKTVVQSYAPGSFSDPADWTWNSGWKDGSGVAITHGDAQDENVIVQVEYDKAGRMMALRDPRGNRTSYAYDLLDRRTALNDPLAHVWATAYASLPDGRSQVTATDPLSFATRQTFDRLGRPVALDYLNENPKLTPDVQFTYDKLGNRSRMNETTDGGTSFVRKAAYGYDGLNRLQQVDFDHDGNGTVDETVSYAYDAGGLRTLLRLPDGKTLAYTYNARGQLTGLTDWASQTTRYTYDGAGRLAALERPNNLISHYRHDAAGRLLRLRHTAGSKTLGDYTFVVDGRGNRIMSTELIPSATTDSTTYNYLNLGVEYFGGEWTTSAPYKVTTTRLAGLRVLFFGTGNATLTVGKGPDHGLFDVHIDGALWQSHNGYAAANGELVLTIPLTGDGPHLLEVQGRGEKDSRSSGYKLRFKSLVTASSNPLYDAHTWEYTYDRLARLVDARDFLGHHSSPVALRQQYTYAYDLAGNRTSEVYTSYIPSGSPQTRTFSYDAANRLTQHTVAQGGFGTVYQVSYDAAGRMASDGENNHTWDRASRLLSMGGSQYAYNGLGQRVQQTISGQVTRYLLDVQPGLWQVLASTTGADTTRFVHGPTGIQQQQNPDNAWVYLVQDGLGSVRGVANATNGILEARHYDPYGQPRGSYDDTPFGFTGEPTDGNGLVSLRARYYNPALGVFPSLDPVEGNMAQTMSLNRYNWADGNVPNRIDPSGMQATCPSGVSMPYDQAVALGFHVSAPAVEVPVPQDQGTPPPPILPPVSYACVPQDEWEAWRRNVRLIVDPNAGLFDPRQFTFNILKRELDEWAQATIFLPGVLPGDRVRARVRLPGWAGVAIRLGELCLEALKIAALLSQVTAAVQETQKELEEKKADCDPNCVVRAGIAAPRSFTDGYNLIRNPDV